MEYGLCWLGYLFLPTGTKTIWEETNSSLLKKSCASIGPLMGVIITLDTIMRYAYRIYFVPLSENWFEQCSCLNISFINSFSLVMKNVDAGGAKELMAYLVKLQSNLTEVNK